MPELDRFCSDEILVSGKDQKTTIGKLCFNIMSETRYFYDFFNRKEIPLGDIVWWAEINYPEVGGIVNDK